MSSQKQVFTQNNRSISVLVLCRIYIQHIFQLTIYMHSRMLIRTIRQTVDWFLNNTFSQSFYIFLWKCNSGSTMSCGYLWASCWPSRVMLLFSKSPSNGISTYSGSMNILHLQWKFLAIAKLSRIVTVL